MITGFEDFTKTLSDDEWAAVPMLVSRIREATGTSVTAKELARLAGWKGVGGEARIRHVVHILRVTGEVRWLIADSRGYRVASSDDDVRIYIRSLDERISSIRSVRNALQNQIDDQISFEFDG